MATIDPVVVQIQADISNLKNGLAQAEQSLKGLQGNVQQSGGVFDAFGGTVKKLGAVLGTTFAATQIFSFFKNAVKGAAEAEAGLTRLRSILLTTGGATEVQIAALEKQAEALAKVGFASKENIITTQSQLATFDLQGKTINKLTPAILDYVAAEKGATASSEDYKQMTNGLAQALQGNFAALTRVGFVLDEDTKKKISNGTESERAAAITEVLNSTYKDFNKTLADTPEGRMAKLKQEFGDLQQTIGEALLPVLSELMNFINTKVFPIAEKLAAGFKKVTQGLMGEGSLGDGFAKIGDTIKSLLLPVVKALEGAFEKVKKAFMDNKERIMDLLKTFKEVWAWVSTVLLPLFSKALVNAVKMAGTNMAAAIKVIIPVVQFVVNTVKGLINGIITVINGMIKGYNKIAGAFGKDQVDLIGKIGEKTYSVQRGLVKMGDEADKTSKKLKNVGDVWAGSKDPKGPTKGSDKKKEEKEQKKLDSLLEKTKKIYASMNKVIEQANEKAQEALERRNETIADAEERYAERVADARERFNEQQLAAEERYAEQVADAFERYGERKFEAEERYQERIANAYERYQSSIVSATNKYNERVSDLEKRAAKEREDAQKKHNETVEKLTLEYTKTVAELEKKHAEKVVALNKRATKEKEQAQKKYAESVKKITADYNEKVLDIEKKYQEKVVDLRAKAQKKSEEVTLRGQEKLADIVEKGRQRLRDAFAKGTEIKLEDLFGVAKEGGGTIVDAIKKQLTQVKALQKSAGELAGLGFTQTFIEQIVQAGPAAGVEMAEAIKKLSPEQQSELRSMYAELESLNTDGMNALAQSMSTATSFATSELAKMYYETQQEIKDNLAAINDELNTTLAEAQKEYATAMAETAVERDTALAESAAALAESLVTIETTLQEGLAEASADLAEGLLDAKTKLSEGLAEAKKVLDESLAASKKALDEGLAEAKKDFDEALAAAKKDYDDALADALKELNKTIADAKTALDKALEAASKALNKSREDAQKDLDKALKDAQATLQKALEDAQKAYEKSIDEINASTKKKLDDLMAQLETVASKIAAIRAEAAKPIVVAAPTFTPITPATPDSKKDNTVATTSTTTNNNITVNTSTNASPSDITTSVINGIKYGSTVTVGNMTVATLTADDD